MSICPTCQREIAYKAEGAECGSCEARRQAFPPLAALSVAEREIILRRAEIAASLMKPDAVTPDYAIEIANQLIIFSYRIGAK